MAKPKQEPVEFEVIDTEHGWNIKYADRSTLIFGSDSRLIEPDEDPGAWVELNSKWRVAGPEARIVAEIRETGYQDVVITKPSECPKYGDAGLEALYLRDEDWPCPMHWREAARILWHEEGVSIRIGWESLPVEAVCALGRAMSGNKSRRYLDWSKYARIHDLKRRLAVAESQLAPTGQEVR